MICVKPLPETSRHIVMQAWLPPSTTRMELQACFFKIFWGCAGFMSQEEQAMQAIRKVIGDPLGMELYELWKEYEELRTVEAIYCKASKHG